MTSELDAALEPGERVLERGTRVGLRRAWRHWLEIILGPVVILLILHFGFDLVPIPLLTASALLFVGLPIAEWLAKTRGSYSAAAIVTTHRLLAATDQATIDELRLADVARVEFVRGVPLRRRARKSGLPFAAAGRRARTGNGDCRRGRTAATVPSCHEVDSPKGR